MEKLKLVLSELDGRDEGFFTFLSGKECKDLANLLLTSYYHSIKDYIKYITCLTPDKLSSGFIFFYGSVLLALNNTTITKRLYSDLINYNILYLIVDNMMDSDNGATNSAIMREVLYNNAKTTNEKINIVKKIYDALISRYPVKDLFFQLFEAQVKSTIVQKKKGLKKEVYLNIYLTKGKLTTMLLSKIIGKLDDEEQIGKTLQIIDDINDIHRDEKDDIYTISRYYLDVEKKLDELVYICIDHCYAIKNNLFRNIYIHGLLYIVYNTPENYSKELIQVISKYTYKKEVDMEEFFGDKLYEKCFGI